MCPPTGGRRARRGTALEPPEALARRLLCSLVVGACLALGVPATAAQAATYRAPDPSGDVRTLLFDEESGDFSSTAAPAGSEPDVTRLVVTHARRSVTMRIRFDALTRPRARQGVGVVFAVRGSNGQRRFVQLFRQARPTKERRTQVVRVSNNRPVCRGAARSTFDFADDVVTVTVPRRCFGAPQRIKVSGYALRIEDTRGDGVSGTTYDDPLVTGGEIEPALLGARSTPWVKRG